MIAPAELIEQPTYDGISMHAYFLWEKNGKPHGRDEEFWMEAEHLLLNQIESEIARTKKETKAPARIKRTASTSKKATTPVSRKTAPATTTAPTKAAPKATKAVKPTSTASKVTSSVSMKSVAKPKTKAKVTTAKGKKSK